MALFTIADLHLSSDGQKNMNVFGPQWNEYMERLKNNWEKVVGENDSVIIPGDISWALKLDEAVEDLTFLNSLPGHKYIGKGNHDFWWTTASKMNALFAENHLDTLHLLNNNAYDLDGVIICGSRGWFVDDTQQKTVGEVDYKKIVNREAVRLEMSLKQGKQLQEISAHPIYCFLHFPPIWCDYRCQEIIDVLKKYDVKKGYFGHIHGCGCFSDNTDFGGVPFSLIAADYLKFTPKKIV